LAATAARRLRPDDRGLLAFNDRRDAFVDIGVMGHHGDVLKVGL